MNDNDESDGERNLAGENDKIIIYKDPNEKRA